MSDSAVQLKTTSLNKSTVRAIRLATSYAFRLKHPREFGLSETELQKTNSRTKLWKSNSGGRSRENELGRTNSGDQTRRTYSGERTSTTNVFDLLRISYGDEHRRSGTPGIEVTKQSKRTSSKPNYKGWFGQTASEFAVGLTRTTASDSFLSRRRRLLQLLETKNVFELTVERRDCSSLPKTRSNF